MRIDERHKLDLFEMKCFCSVCGVIRMDRWRIEEVRRRVGEDER